MLVYISGMHEASQILLNTLAERKSANPHYSQKSFAADLGLSPQQLSNLLTGKRGLSHPLAEKVATRANLDVRRKTIFLESLKATFSLSQTQRIIAQAKLTEIHAQGETKNLEIDLFKTISNWYHLALVEMIRISKNKPMNPKVLSHKFNISENEIGMALGRLERLDLISRTDIGWKVNQDVVTFEQTIPTDAVKSFHRQILEKSIQALGEQGTQERYGSSSAIPIKFKSLDRAKKLIQEFRESLSKEIADRDEGEAVYGLTIQLFNLAQLNSETLV